MKRVPLPDLEYEEDHDEFFNTGKVAMADRRRALEALEGVDELLRKHGLEVVCYTGHSDYVFGIEPLDQEIPDTSTK